MLSFLENKNLKNQMQYLAGDAKTLVGGRVAILARLTILSPVSGSSEGRLGAEIVLNLLC